MKTCASMPRKENVKVKVSLNKVLKCAFFLSCFPRTYESVLIESCNRNSSVENALHMMKSLLLRLNCFLLVILCQDAMCLKC